VINDEGVDGALVLLTPQSMTDVAQTAEAIVGVARRSHKPILSCFMGIVDVSAGVKYLQEHGYPVYKFPENAAKAFAALYRHSRWLQRQQFAPFKFKHDREAAAAVIQGCLATGQTYLGELEGLKVLSSYGFNVLPTVLAATADQAVAHADSMGYPVVMKIVSPDIVHKSDAGGVQVGLNGERAVRKAFETIVDNAVAYKPDADIKGVLVQQMAPAGEEVILGMNRMPGFGPLLMFGFGGIFVEVFKDVSFRLGPIGRNEARRMIKEIKAFKLLTGFRGRPPADIEVLEQLLAKLSDLVIDHPQIEELDINPLRVHPQGQGATVADCRIVLKAPIING
jgi:acetate---CoA ligase (ADP-forming)